MIINRRLISLCLSLLGVAGVGVTSWLSVKCHDKAKDEPDKKKKVKHYIPAIVAGVGTGACILGSHHISAKEIAALTTACGYFAGNRDKIVEKIRERYGDEVAAEVQKEALPETKEKEIFEMPDKKFLPRDGRQEGLVRCVEFYLGRSFWSTLDDLEQAEAELNYRFHNGEYVCMNDFYQLLGLRMTSGGNDFGWPANNDYYDYELETPIIFDNILGEDEDGNPMYMIDIRTRPMECWMEV